MLLTHGVKVHPDHHLPYRSFGDDVVVCNLLQLQSIHSAGWTVGSTEAYEAMGAMLTICRLYEGFAIVAVFLLYVQIVASDAQSCDAFFRELEAKKKGSPAWFRVTHHEKRDS